MEVRWPEGKAQLAKLTAKFRSRSQGRRRPDAVEVHGRIVLPGKKGFGDEGLRRGRRAAADVKRSSNRLTGLKACIKSKPYMPRAIGIFLGTWHVRLRSAFSRTAAGRAATD